MAERLSALTRVAHEGAGEGRVVLSEWRAASILQVQSWPDTLEKRMPAGY